MTEPDWHRSADPSLMLGFLRNRGLLTERKYVLFGVACVRQVWPLLADERSRAAVELVEGWADGEGGKDELRKADRLSLRGLRWSWSLPEPYVAAARAARILAGRDEHNPMDDVARYATQAHPSAGPSKACSTQAAALHCIFGNPFKPVASDPSWRTSTAVALARQMYESRDFGTMPILADALSDAGCEDARIKGHCRGGGEHWRGCWVIDLVLEKS